MQEIWKDVAWYEWFYKVSNLWKIKSLSRYVNNNWWKMLLKESILKTQYDKDWYKIIWLYKSWKQKHYRLHRIIAEAFLMNEKNMPVINHINWIKDDNRIENLEWCTVKHNNIEAFRIWLKIWTWKWKFWPNSASAKKTIQYDMNWTIIKEWWSISDAMRLLKIDKSAIVKCCKWKAKTAWWFIWKYKIN